MMNTWVCLLLSVYCSRWCYFLLLGTKVLPEKHVSLEPSVSAAASRTRWERSPRGHQLFVSFSLAKGVGMQLFYLAPCEVFLCFVML